LAEAGAAALDELDGPRLDTPPWLWSAWGADARAIAEAHQQEAPLDLTLRPGERIADLCAAPGGKTAQLAAAGAVVTAVERDAARLDRLRANLVRLRLPAEC